MLHGAQENTEVKPSSFLNLRVLMLEQSWGQKRFLILTYTRVSFVVGFGWRNSFLHVLVDLEIGKRKERILLLECIVLRELLFSC